MQAESSGSFGPGGTGPGRYEDLRSGREVHHVSSAWRALRFRVAGARERRLMRHVRTLRRGGRAPFRTAALLPLLFLLVLSLFPAAAGKALAQGFNDLSGQPEEIRQAVEYAAQRGYMQGFPDGGFHPEEALSRIDCARALVSVFGHAGESADPAVTFTDLPPSHPDFIWANLAVKYGLMDRLPDGSFQPSQGTAFERVAAGVAAGAGMGDVASNVDVLTGGSPWYGGAMAVFMGLRCKYRYSRVWPGQAYPRGEMAYTLYRLDHMESWRPWYVRDSLSTSRCKLPAATESQRQAVAFAFERLGCPYVYGGERESEGGFDCSGFVYNTLSIRMGYPMQRVADDQARDNRYLFVSRQALPAGDAIFFYENADDNPEGHIGHAGMYVGNGIFIHSGGSNGGVAFDCLENNDYWRTHFAWGRRVVGGPYNDRFDTWLLLYNPGEYTQPVSVRFLRSGREPETRDYRLAPHSRFTLPVDDLYAYDELSMEVEAPAPGVIAERAMYFDYGDWADDGHASEGLSQPSPRGYFAEGYTGRGFHTWLLMVNPGDVEAQVEVDYLPEGHAPVKVNYSLPPRSRFTVWVNGVAGLPEGSVGISYLSLNGVPVAAERAMYFDYFGRRGGHCSAAVENPSTHLFLAEGYTGDSFDTWILLANPNPEAAEVRLEFCREDSSTVSVGLEVPARSRMSLCVDEIAGMGACSFATRMDSDLPLFMERSMYFYYKDRSGGTNCTAQEGPYQRRFFAEGYTGG